MISVIIPAFNACRTIGETVESILRQTLPPDEVIVVDDGSTDGTGNHPVLTSSIVRVCRQENAGAAAALNRGLSEVKGDVLGFLDADDLWCPRKLEWQTAVLERDPSLSGVSGHFESFACPTSTAAEQACWSIPATPQEGWIQGALLMRSDAAARVGTFPEGISAGYNVDWIARMRDLGERVAMVPQVVLHRRIHSGSLSHRSAERDSGYLKIARMALERRRKGLLPHE